MLNEGRKWVCEESYFFLENSPVKRYLQEIAGDTIKEKGKRHYHLGELAIVGEATVLAMRTNVSKVFTDAKAF